MANMAKCGFSGPQNHFYKKRMGRSYWLNPKELPITAENDHFRGKGIQFWPKKRLAPIGNDLKKYQSRLKIIKIQNYFVGLSKCSFYS